MSYEFTNDAKAITAIKSQIVAMIAEITVRPKPTYRVGGMIVSWNDYLIQLQASVDWCNAMLAGDTSEL